MKEKETSLSKLLITTGLNIIGFSIPKVWQFILAIIGNKEGVNIPVSTDYLVFFSGFILIIAGILYSINIKDRVFILNMLGLYVQKEINEVQNIKSLKLADFKVKEMLIDFIDIFNAGIKDQTEYMDAHINNLICEKIENKCKIFINRSSGFKACFTGMASIPYTILAGTYMVNGNVRRYFEYKRKTSGYYELSCRKIPSLKKSNNNLSLIFPKNKNTALEDVVLTISITHKVNHNDLARFQGMDYIDISVSKPDDNIITTIDLFDNSQLKVIYATNERNAKSEPFPCVPVAA